MTPIQILSTIGLLLLCGIFGAMGLIEAHKPGYEEKEELAVNPNFYHLAPTYTAEATEPIIEENQNDQT